MQAKGAGKTRDPEATPSFWVNQLSRSLMRHFDDRLRPLGFGLASWTVVSALLEDGALLQKDLAERAHVEQPTMAALLSRMERDGLISREPHPEDKRATRISLSARAKSRMPSARDAMNDVAEQMVKDFNKHDRAIFLELLRRALTNLEDEK